MTIADRPLSVLAAFALVVALAGCDGDARKKQIESRYRDLAAAADNASEGDPALTGALEDQITIDPALAGRGARSEGKALISAPPSTPAAARNKVTLGELAAIQSTRNRSAARAKGCDRNYQYSVAWVKRLPAAIPLYPGARVSEAAGNDASGCRMRIVSFTTAAPLKTALDWYYAHAIRAGYTAEHQAADGEHILAGAQPKGDGAYYIFFRPLPGGGSEVDLVANQGL